MREYANYTRRMEGRKKLRAERIERLHECCRPESISSVFQPIVELASGDVLMYEALTRFSAESGLNTAQWFEEAVDLDMSIDLEIATLARTISALAEHDDQTLTVAVNVSPETLLSFLLAPTLGNIDPSRVVIEITEHAEIKDYAKTKATIEKFRRSGGRLAIDDAGAGFASMRHIVDLQPDLIKLDISMVRNIHEDRARRAMAAGLISFAREMDAEVVAEGIETMEELEALRELGAHMGQGFVLARPAELSEAVTEQIAIG
jgi:EAL domain-containing protein (putative c-di-GMP-specific phosphodiesterase class I)